MLEQCFQKSFLDPATGVSKGIAVLRGRLGFTQMYSFKKLMFLHQLLRQNSVCLNACFFCF